MLVATPKDKIGFWKALQILHLQGWNSKGIYFFYLKSPSEYAYAIRIFNMV